MYFTHYPDSVAPIHSSQQPWSGYDLALYKTYHVIPQWSRFGIYTHLLALLATWNFTSCAWHDATRVYEIEHHKRQQHGQRVKTILESLMKGNFAIEALRVFT